MPFVVPTSQEQFVRPVQLPRARPLGPDAFGAGLGRGIASLSGPADVITGRLLRMDALEGQRFAREQYNRIRERAGVEYETNYSSRTGSRAAGVTKDFGEYLDEEVKGLDFPDSQSQAAFGALWSEWRQAQMRSLASHEQQQRAQGSVTTAQAQINLGVQEAGRFFNDDAHLDHVLDDIADASSLLLPYMEQDQVIETASQGASDAVLSAIMTAAVIDTARAREILNKEEYSDLLSVAAKRQALAEVKKHEQVNGVIDATDEYATIYRQEVAKREQGVGYLNRQDIFSKIDKRFKNDDEKRRAVKQQTRIAMDNFDSDMAKQQLAESDALFRAIRDDVAAGRMMDATQKILVGATTRKAQASMTKWLSDYEKTNRLGVNGQRMSELRMMAEGSVDEQDTFLAMDMQEEVGEIGINGLAEVDDLKLKLQKDRNIKTWETQINQEVKYLTSKDPEVSRRFRTTIRHEISELEDLSKRPIQQEEFDRIVAIALAEQVTVYNWWPDTVERRFLVIDPNQPNSDLYTDLPNQATEAERIAYGRLLVQRAYQRGDPIPDDEFINQSYEQTVKDRGGR